MLSLLVSLPSLTTAPATNTALVFIKPHAATDAWEGYIKKHLSSSGIRIIDSGVKYAAEIDSNRLIDQHYGSLARLAVEQQQLSSVFAERGAREEQRAAAAAGAGAVELS